MAASVLPTSSAPPSPRKATLSGPPGRRGTQTATEACGLLRRRGWTTSLARLRVVGETDVRLLAAPPGSAVTVELLCPCPDAPDDAGPWAAVRIEDDERAVWRGPEGSCTVETLARFLDDLVRRSGGELAERYRCCG